MTESVSRYRTRALVLTGCLVLLLGAVVVRLGYLQIVRHDDLARLAERQYSKTIPLRPERGPILDRNGYALAVSAPVESVYALPAKIGDRGAVAAALAPHLGERARDIEQRLASEDDRMRLMKQIWQLGAAAGLQLNRVDYHTEVDAGGRFNRLLITLPMTGSYPAVRKLMFTLMAEFPGLSLDKIDMKRDQTASAQVETLVHMTLHTRP